MLSPGPTWNSFEDFRRQGTSALELIVPRCAATLNSKAGMFRILREQDFQYLVGLGAEVGRLQKGMKFVYQAAKVAQIHPDKESIELLIQSFSLIAQSPELPQRAGHRSFELTPEEIKEEESSDSFDFSTGEIPRPQW